MDESDKFAEIMKLYTEAVFQLSHVAYHVNKPLFCDHGASEHDYILGYAHMLFDLSSATGGPGSLPMMALFARISSQVLSEMKRLGMTAEVEACTYDGKHNHQNVRMSRN